MNEVQMAHGSGGQAMQQLINQLFLEAFDNPWLAEQEDQARLDLAELTASGDRLAFSTDSYVIDPLFFPGGNIGKLASIDRWVVFTERTDGSYRVELRGKTKEINTLAVQHGGGGHPLASGAVADNAAELHAIEEELASL